MMRGFVGARGLIIIGAVILLFGGAVYDMSTAGVRCGLAALNRGNYTCADFGTSIGATVVFPDRNIQKGVDSILLLRDYSQRDPETYAALAGVVSTDEANYRNMILVGLVGVVALVGAFAWLLLKIAPSAEWDLGGKVLVLVAALVIYGVAYMAYTGYAEGNMQLPFTGAASLIAHPDVLSASLGQALPQGANHSDANVTSNQGGQ